MKKFISIISWVSFVTIALFFGFLSLIAGILTCNYLADVLGIYGSFYGLFLVPVLFAVSMGSFFFIFLGLRKFGEQNY